MQIERHKEPRSIHMQKNPEQFGMSGRTAHQGVQAPTGTVPLHQAALWTHPAEV